VDVAHLGIKVDASGGIASLDKFGKKTEETASKVDKFSETVKHVGEVLAVAFLGEKFLHETIVAQDAVADLESAVQTLGGSSGKTYRELNELADSIQDTTRFSNEAAMGAESMLLVFNRISGDKFADVTRLAADLATKLKIDLPSAAEMIGRALQDPANGLLNLQRKLRLFDEAQVNTIQLMARSGDRAKAQAMIYDALKGKVEGAAAASRNTLGGALDYVTNQFHDLFEISKGSTMGVVGLLNKLGEAFGTVKGYMTQVVGAIGAVAAAWLAYKIAGYTVVAVNAAIAAGQTLSAFLSLVRVVRSMADAMALLQLVGGTAVKIVITIAAMAAGWLAYKKIVEEMEKAQAKLNDTVDETAKKPPPVDVDEVARLRELAFKAQLGKTAEDAQNQLDIAKEQLRTWGQSAVALEKLKNLHEATAAQHDANSRAQQKEITHGERDRLKQAAERARLVKDDAVEMAALADQVKKIWENVINGISNIFTTFFENVFTKGIRTFADLVGSIKDMFVKMAADLLSHQLMQKLLSFVAGDKGPDVGTKQISAAAIMLNAASIQAAAANTMATAAGVAHVTTMSGNAIPQLSGAAKAAGFAGIGIAGFGVGYTAGSSIGGVAGVATGTLGGAAAGAAMGSIIPGIGTAVGAVIGGVTGFVGSVLGAGKAAREAQKQFEAMKRQLDASLVSVKAQVGVMSQLDASLAETRIQFDDLRKQARETYAGRKHEGDRADALNDINHLEQLRLQQLKDEAVLTQRLTKEGIDARLLRTQGRDVEADALELKIQHEREYADAVKQGLDAATLASLKYVQQKEEEAAAANKASSAALNIPSGYKIAAAAFAAMSPELGRLGGVSMPTFPSTPLGGPMAADKDGEPTSVLIVMDGLAVGKGVIKRLGSKAASQFGDASRWSEVTFS
jgi:hypothetical protein